MSKALMDETMSGENPLDGSTFGPDEVRQLEALRAEQTGDIRQALRQLEEELESGTRSRVTQLKAGVAMYLLGRHAEANDILGHLKSEPIAAYYQGLALISLDRPADAAEAFERAGDNGYHDPVQAMLARAGAARAAGHHDQAEKILKEAGKKGGATRAEYSFQMGCLCSDRGDTYGAVEYFERAVDMDPTHSRALFWLASENALRGNDDEAVRLYEKSLSKPPLHLAALINLGLLYEDQDNFNAAAFCFRRVLEVQPNHGRARLYLRDIDAASDMYYDEDSARSQAKLKQVLEIPVTDFELSVRARNCLQKMGVKNLGDLTRLSEQELLGSKNFGETSLTEIKDMLATKGLRLGQVVMTKDRPREYGYGQENLSPQQVALLARPVADLNLSVRARKCMARLNITSLGELTQRTADELLESKNFGVTSLNEVRAKLTELGLRLRNE